MNIVYEVWLEKKTKLMLLKIFIFHYLQFDAISFNVLSSSVYTPLHTNFPLFIAMLQIIFGKSIHYFRRFFFYASTLSNLVPFKADLTLGKRKKITGRNQVNRVDGQRWECCDWLKASSLTTHCELGHCLGLNIFSTQRRNVNYLEQMPRADWVLQADKTREVGGARVTWQARQLSALLHSFYCFTCASSFFSSHTSYCLNIKLNISTCD